MVQTAIGNVGSTGVATAAQLTSGRTTPGGDRGFAALLASYCDTMTSQAPTTQVGARTLDPLISQALFSLSAKTSPQKPLPGPKPTEPPPRAEKAADTDAQRGPNATERSDDRAAHATDRADERNPIANDDTANENVPANGAIQPSLALLQQLIAEKLAAQTSDDTSTATPATDALAQRQQLDELLQNLQQGNDPDGLAQMLERLAADPEAKEAWQSLSPEEGKQLLTELLSDKKFQARLDAMLTATATDSASSAQVATDVAAANNDAPVSTDTSEPNESQSAHEQSRSRDNTETNSTKAAVNLERHSFADSEAAARLAAAERYDSHRNGTQANAIIAELSQQTQESPDTEVTTPAPAQPAKAPDPDLAAAIEKALASRAGAPTGNADGQRPADTRVEGAHSGESVTAVAGAVRAGAGSHGSSGNSMGGFSHGGSQQAQSTAASTPTSAGAPLASTMLQSDIFRQLMDKAKLWTLGDKEKVLTVQLQPEELGRIDLSLTSKDGVVTARVATENPQVKNLLEPLTGQIKSHLESLGIRFDQLRVDVNAGTPDDSKEHSDSSNDRLTLARLARRHRNRSRVEAAEVAVTGDTTDAPIRGARTASGQIDVTA